MIAVEVVPDEILAWEQVGDEVAGVEFTWPEKGCSDRAGIRVRMIEKIDEMLRDRCSVDLTVRGPEVVAIPRMQPSYLPYIWGRFRGVRAVR